MSKEPMKKSHEEERNSKYVEKGSDHLGELQRCGWGM